MKKYNCFFSFSLGLILELSLENPLNMVKETSANSFKTVTYKELYADTFLSFN